MRPHKQLVVNTADAIPYDHMWSLEEIGAAWVLTLYEARKRHALDDDSCRMVLRISKQRWRKIRENVTAARMAIVGASEPRVQAKRQPLSKAARDAIYERDGRICSYCDTDAGPFHIDHIVPVARGGTNRPENLCVACAPCNFRKRAQLVSEMGGGL